MCDLVQDVAGNVLCHSQGHCVHNWKDIANMENNLCTLGSARCLCPLKIGMAQQSLASARPVGLASLAEHAGMHSSLPLFQTQHTGIILKVSFDNPSYKKKSPPANGLPWTLLRTMSAMMVQWPPAMPMSCLATWQCPATESWETIEHQPPNSSCLSPQCHCKMSFLIARACSCPMPMSCIMAL